MRLQPNPANGNTFNELFLEAPAKVDAAARPVPRLDGVVIGTLHSFDGTGAPCVEFPGNPSGGPLPAQAACALAEADFGREVALLFVGGEPRRPVVLGVIQNPVAPTPVVGAKPGLCVEADGQRLVLTADKEVVLRCGQASITLTKAGKVLIRGTYLLSRSSGANRIKGGSVQLN